MKVPAQPNASLINGIACFQEVIAAGEPVGSREVARRTDMSPTKVNRILGTLGMLGLVSQAADRKYIPGPGVHVLAAQSMGASRLLPAAMPVLMDLRAEGFTVSLGVLWQDKVCHLLSERISQSTDQALQVPGIVPANSSSVGIALMAARDIDPRAWTWPDMSALQEHPDGVPGAVAEARLEGYAVRRYTGGELSLGVAIGEPAMAGLAVSARRIGEEYIPEIVQLLRASAARIEKRLEELTA